MATKNKKDKWAVNSAELGKAVGCLVDYGNLAQRVADGFGRAFGTVVHGMSRGKATVRPAYVGNVNTGEYTTEYTFSVDVAGKRRRFVHAVTRSDAPGESKIITGRSGSWKEFPFTAEGIRAFLVSIGAVDD